MSIRTERIARLLQRDLADILNGEFGLASGPLVTVTHVRVTRDLSLAYVQLSVMAETASERKTSFIHVSERASQIRLQLASRVRHQLRAVPELRFFLDETVAEAAKIDQLLNQIRTDRESHSPQPDALGDNEIE